MTGGPAGAQVTGISFGDANGRLMHDPTHPLADADGMVRYPDIDMGDQMTQLMIAQRGYQANLAVIDRARDAYQQALSIGR
jgi:flagellar basal-body rod protein FlgC